MTRKRKAYKEAAERDNGACVICNGKADDVHHFIFKSQGGDDIVNNLVCLCRLHHEQAHARHGNIDRLITEYLESHYGKFTKQSLKKKGRYDEFKY